VTELSQVIARSKMVGDKPASISPADAGERV
jgi:hypothetical protein